MSFVAPRAHRLKLLIAAGLMVATLALFARAGGYGFVNYDDANYVTSNPHVTTGLTPANIAWAWRTTYFGNWHPLVWMSLQLDAQVYGLDLPPGFHWTNLLLHAANVVILFWVLQRMTGALGPSTLAAALFAVHPLNVETVVWVSERKGVLSTFFWMLTLLAYVRYTERPGQARYWVVVLFFVCGCMAKPMVVTLPFVLLLLDFWPLGRWTTEGKDLPPNRGLTPPARGLVWEKIPLFVLAVLFGVIAVYAQHAARALTALKVPLTGRLANACVTYVTCICKAVWPSGLTCYYPHPGDSIPWWQATAAALLLVVVTALVVRGGRRRPYLAVGWLWYLGTLLPVIGLLPIGWHGSADRYTYVPLIGLFIMVAWGAAELARPNPKSQILNPKSEPSHLGFRIWDLGLPAVAAVFVSVAVLMGYAAVTWIQEGYWCDSLTLWQRALSVTSHNAVAHSCLGSALEEKGRVASAMTHYEEAVQIDPEHPLAQYNLALAYLKQGKFAASASHGAVAVQLDPEFAPAHVNLGAALERLGKPQEAAEQYMEASRLDPGSNTLARNNLGLVLVKLGRTEEAIGYYREALHAHPEQAELHYNLANAEALAGHRDEAILHFREALRLDTRLAKAHRNLASVLQADGRTDEALDHFQDAIRLEPGNALAHSLAAEALASRGRLDEAVQHTEMALQLDSHDDGASAMRKADCWNRLGYLRLRRGQPPGEAVSCFREAVDLQPQVARFRCGLASALLEQGATAAASAEYKEASRLDANWPETNLREAWSLATHPDAARRDGPRAVELAEQVCHAPGGQEPKALDVLAAAYAASGRFADAVATARQALALASAAGREGLAKEIAPRLRLYEQRQPFHDATLARP
jgi:tetratricopeptide (TPR) repeat protein